MSRVQADEPLFRDDRFRKKNRKGEWEVVEPPYLPVPVADTHAHLQMMPDPALSLARAALNKVGFVETIVDPSEDGTITFEKLDEWIHQAGLNMYKMYTPC